MGDPLEPAHEVVVRRAPDRRRIEAFALGLDAAGVDSRIERGEGEWRLVVSAEAAPAAERALDGFDAEVDALIVRQLPPPPEPPSSLGLLAAAGILGMYIATGPVDVDGPWFRRGGAVAQQILHGELYRTVTALCLHADFSHAFGNAAFALLLVGAVGRALGGGVGGLLLLLSGALGNLATAIWYHRTDHLSIGASTAIFAAVGILATPGTWRRGSRFPPWVALGASLAFLGMVGTGGQADVAAHVGGTLSGYLLGWVAVFAKRPPAWAQRAIGGLAIGLVGMCWGAAFFGS